MAKINNDQIGLVEQCTHSNIVVNLNLGTDSTKIKGLFHYALVQGCQN